MLERRSQIPVRNEPDRRQPERWRARCALIYRARRRRRKRRWLTKEANERPADGFYAQKSELGVEERLA